MIIGTTENGIQHLTRVFTYKYMVSSEVEIKKGVARRISRRQLKVLVMDIIRPQWQQKLST